MKKMTYREAVALRCALKAILQAMTRDRIKAVVLQTLGSIAPEANLSQISLMSHYAIVVGSHGLRGITRLLIGSVAEAVAVHAHCSVEVIRERVTRKQ